MLQQPRLSIRKSEATNLGRATNFNRKNIGDCFDNLDHIMVRYKFVARSIYNPDKTGLTNVHRPPNVVAEIGAMQVGQVTSAERGTIVTMNCAVNPLGNAIPPFLIFLRVNFIDFMIKNAPPGSVGVPHKSGWLTSTNFKVWLDHFIKHTACSPEYKLFGKRKDTHSYRYTRKRSISRRNETEKK